MTDKAKPKTKSKAKQRTLSPEFRARMADRPDNAYRRHLAAQKSLYS